MYIIEYGHQGRQRWLRIVEHGSPWTPETARREALRLLGFVAQDQDPAAVTLTTRTAPTVANLCERFLTKHAPKKKASKAAE